LELVSVKLWFDSDLYLSRDRCFFNSSEARIKVLLAGFYLQISQYKL